MSQIYKLPILFGSRAAEIGGFLPDGKDPRNMDYDVLTTAENLAYFAQVTGITHIEHIAGRATLTSSDENAIDIDIASAELYDAIAKICTETVVVKWAKFDLQLILATAEIVWITRGITAGYVPSKIEQALKDTVHYGKLPIELTTDHLRVFELVLRNASEKRLHSVLK